MVGDEKMPSCSSLLYGSIFINKLTRLWGGLFLWFFARAYLGFNVWVVMNIVALKGSLIGEIPTNRSAAGNAARVRLALEPAATLSSGRVWR